MSRPAVFFDRDGTLCVEAGYVNHPSRLRLAPGAAAAVRAVRELGFLAVLATNQAGIARGLLTPTVLADTHRRLERLLGAEETRLDGIYSCVHHPDAGAPPLRRPCACRKPGPGLLLAASTELGLDLAGSYVVGDRLRDIAAGYAAGVRGTVLLRTGYGRGELLAAAGGSAPWPHHVADDLDGAVRWITARAAVGAGKGSDR